MRHNGYVPLKCRMSWFDSEGAEHSMGVLNATEALRWATILNISKFTVSDRVM